MHLKEDVLKPPLTKIWARFEKYFLRKLILFFEKHHFWFVDFQIVLPNEFKSLIAQMKEEAPNSAHFQKKSELAQWWWSSDVMKLDYISTR